MDTRSRPENLERDLPVPSGVPAPEGPTAGSVGPIITHLPQELIDMISDHLPLYDIIRLGVTCRHFYNKKDVKFWYQVRCTKIVNELKGSRYIPVIEAEERWKFLKNLELDLPNLELCHFCEIFHPRGSPQQQSLERVPHRGSTGAECNAKEVQFRRWSIDWGFGFRDIYAITNRLVHGEAHGQPLSDLCFSTNWAFAECYRKLYNATKSPFKRFLSYIKLDAEALIVDQQVLVHRIQRLWIPNHVQGSEVLLRYGVGDLACDFKICAHHNPQSGEMIHNFVHPFRESLRVVMVTAFNASDSYNAGSSQPQVFVRCHKCPSERLIRRCEDCPTEYEVTFYVHNNKGIEVVLDVWQNLGRCRSPLEPGWANCWGRANPRFQAPAEEQWRKDWIQSDVAYIVDKSIFPTGPGLSAASHHSAQAVHDHWEVLYRNPEPDPLPGPRIPIESALTSDRLQTLQRFIEYSRYEIKERKDLPRFPLHPSGGDGPAHVAYTRTNNPERCPPPVEQPNHVVQEFTDGE
ncbi:uncharacterized protein BCR38DRAFT_161853 [Pseudomassariella vexata]|uniref:F-box domain-containing protein n=1 Tax=Pseudomassariella vexata TaxID=1141098 RepID=A0A1Y2E890_9PEZI|nr:uncharacterized protein BCR38DRAFT_161853 [Pseudomassariella vexata]ORY67647.1 hypothetical protein BCR38DRAFT_161853 [Pseudomassariella vexata]